MIYKKLWNEAIVEYIRNLFQLPFQRITNTPIYMEVGPWYTVPL